ncbi:MAG TPA: hypothetical protein DHW39_07125 [Erysipelotrichaceae bacterium]|nr:hypothetical protein [Erysipelotrichaceae bacterium]
MRLKVAPFRIYVDEVTALRRPQMSIRDAYGRLYDADLYYVYGYIVPGKGIRFRVLASASEKPFRLLSDQYNAVIDIKTVIGGEIVIHPPKEEKIKEKYASVIDDISWKYKVSDDVYQTRFMGELDRFRDPCDPDRLRLPYDKGPKMVTVEICGMDGNVPYGSGPGKKMLLVLYEDGKYYVKEKVIQGF